MLKKMICVLAVVMGILPMTACWDHVEISELLIVAGVGLDLDDAGGTYRATVEVINVEAEGGENIAAEIVEGEGRTMYDAIQNAMLMTGGTMFNNHCKVIVIGDALAREGVGGVIDLILRNPNFRKTVDVLIAKDCTAKSVMKQKTVKNDVVSYELSKILKSNARSLRNTVATGVYEIHEILISDCAYFVAPTVYARENNGGDVLLVEGCAVFAGERLRGFLDGAQSRLYHIVARDARSVTVPIEDPAISPTPVDVEITRSGVRLSPGLREDTPTMHVALSAEATLKDAVLSDTDISDGQKMKRLQDSINARLSADIEQLVADVQSRYESDIFEFYREYEDVYRRDWAGLKQDWGARFRQMEVSVASDLRITGSGLIGNYTSQAGDPDNANALP